jgi:hypothetical protein
MALRRSSENFRKTLCAALLIAVALLITPAAAAAKPTLIVRATTKLENQGAPLLDLFDLERFFVKKLIERGVENVVPSATARSPRPPRPDMYLLELSVDVLRRGERVEWDARRKRSDSGAVFHVELSLTVKHPRLRRVLGRTGERREYTFNWWREEEKQGAVYDAAGHLARRFLSEAKAGAFDGQLTTIDPSFDWSAKSGMGVELIVAVVVLLIALIVGVFITRDCERVKREEFYDGWNKRLEDARTRALETDNFSDTWVEAASRQKRDELHKNAATIERQEAQRQVYAKERETEYREIAAYAAERHGLDAKEVTEMLRKADELPYRLLQAAKKVKVEAA